MDDNGKKWLMISIAVFLTLTMITAGVTHCNQNKAREAARAEEVR